MIIQMIHMSQEEFEECRDECVGICLACKEFTDGVEPDAENYRCENCDKLKVMGIELAFVSGVIDVFEDYD